MAVSLAAFYHPLRLAEEVAMIDVLSGGRVNWGAGRGFDRAEFEAFGVPVEESSDRFREAVEIVLAAWRDDRIAYQGRFWSFDGQEVLPKPLQSPHPPVWLAATSRDSIRRAAEKGYDILQDPHATHADIGAKRAYYHEVLREHGFPVQGRVIPTARMLAVGATEAEAEEVARAGAAWTVASYANPSKRAGPPPAHWNPDVDPVERYMNEVVLRGTPERVIDKIAELREIDRPRLPHVRAPQPQELHALHRPGAPEARRRGTRGGGGRRSMSPARSSNADGAEFTRTAPRPRCCGIG